MRAAGPTYTHRGDMRNFHFRYTVDKDRVQRMAKFPDHTNYNQASPTQKFKTRLHLDFDWERHSEDWPETVTLSADLPWVVEAFGGFAPKP